MSFTNYCETILKKSIEAQWRFVDFIAGIPGITGAFPTWLLPIMAPYVQLAYRIVGRRFPFSRFLRPVGERTVF